MNEVEIFGSVVVLDFEYEIEEGNLPIPLCLVAYVLDETLQHVRTVRLWRGEFGSAPPFDTGPDTLIVAYSAWAELTCFMVLGWKFPEHVYDLHTTYLASSNILLPYSPNETRKRQPKGLADACKAYGIEGWEKIDKKGMAKDIGAGRWRDYGQAAVLEYNEEDVKKSTELLRMQLQGHSRYEPVDPGRVIYWSDYSAKAIARIQAKGMPIDVRLWDLVQENKQAVIAALIAKFDPSHGSAYPIYDENGEWSEERIALWLTSIGVTAWPRTETGRFQIDSDAMRLMSHIPGVENLHALRDSLGVIVKARLPIGRDGRNRPSLFPFGAATGRNAHARSLFNAHAGMRSFMVFPEDKIGLYLDWRTQEIGVCAAYSGDQQLIEDYRDGDVYHALALMCGLTTDTNIKRWKHEQKDQRQRMKALNLAVGYGMGVPSLARGLNRHPLVASDIIERHRRRYPRFWEWREECVQHALLDRQLESDFSGWPLYLSNSPNKRTLYNFFAQSGGAEMLRLTATRLCEAGIVPCMLIHDAVLLEVRDQEEVEHAIEIMGKAGTEVCRGLEIGVGIDQRLENGKRYEDGRDVAKAMWRTVLEALHDVGVRREDYNGLRPAPR